MSRVSGLISIADSFGRGGRADLRRIREPPAELE